LIHITGKENFVANMLSKARYMCESEMKAQEINDDHEREDYGYILVVNGANSSSDLPFKEELYHDRLKDIGIYLSTLKRQQSWLDKTLKDIKHQSYDYFLRDGSLWKRPKKKDGVPLRVVDDTKTKSQVLKKFHDSLWGGHKGVWTTYYMIKERY